MIFTGQGRAWALGTVGYRFDNDQFASALWQETQDKGTYRHIYSLASFEEVDVPYAAINEPLGLLPTNHFQTMTVYDRHGKAEAVAEALHLRLTAPPGASYDDLDRALASELASEAHGLTWLAPIEAVHSASTSYVTSARGVIVHRGEALLVAAYAATLDAGIPRGRHFLSVGVTDLWIEHPDGPELVEAKSVASRDYVRQALAQLLYYATATPQTPRVLTALFPERPTPPLVSLLHNYGIDCVYRIAAHGYDRLQAPAEARERLASLWGDVRRR